MSTMADQADGGSSQSASEVSLDNVSGMAKLIAELSKNVLGTEGQLTMSAEDVIALRRADTRQDILEKMVVELVPSTIDPKRWLTWLRGGSYPFSQAELKRKPGADRSSGPMLERSSNMLKSLAKKVQDREEDLELARAEFDRAQSYEQAVLQFAIQDQFAKLMSPSFAMGPAWTLMRSISAHLDTEAMQKTLRQASSPKHRDEMEAKIISLRREETEAIMRSLDLWCGEPDFEEELRLAILGVVEQFRGREEQRDTGSNRGRGREARRVQVNPNSTAQAEAVLDGLKLEPF